MKFVSKAENCV